MSRKQLILMALAILTLLVSACNPERATPAAILPWPTATYNGQLTPYRSPTATRTPTATLAPSATFLPSPSPTPRTHEVKKGEDLSGIAWQYGVSLPDLLAANPTVNPHFLSIGTQLLIPTSKTPMPGGKPTPTATAQSLPTPVPLKFGTLTCTPVQDGGVWCFQGVENNQTFPVESVSAVIRLSDAQGKTQLTQTAFLPLDLLPPGMTLPLAAYFPPADVARIALPFSSASEPAFALRNIDDGRYVRTRLSDQKVQIAADGLAAEIDLKVWLDQHVDQARRVWVAAVAYDGQGNIVGVRRWENDHAHPLNKEQALSVKMQIYSVADEIRKVDLLSEARP